jgi:hypothetical protein
MTYLYAAFGGTLQSEIEIPELVRERDGAVPTWALRLAEPAAAEPGDAVLGSDVVYGTCEVHGFLGRDAYRLVFDDTGRFDVSRDGRTMTWFRPPEASLSSAIADVTSRVIALALHAGGVYSLHASAVSLDGNGIAFVAPKFHGKSTLCSAMVRAGALAMSDDTVPVMMDGGTRLAPGIPRLRLWGDSASRFFDSPQEQREQGRKYLIERLPEDQVETRTVPFSAAYVLSPVANLGDGSAVQRERLGSISAVMSLLTHAKLGPILGGTEAQVLLSRAAAIAESVPVYELNVIRDLDRVEEVARTIAGWHQAGAPASAR